MTDYGVVYWADPSQPIAKIGQLANVAESLGFSNLWLWDTPLYTKDVYVALTVAAVNTKNILLGTGVSNPLTRHISISANAISTIDDLSNGRAILGFGNGAPGSANVLGFSTPRISEFRRSLVQIKSLLKGDAITTDIGTEFKIPSVKREIPIYIGAWGPRMLELTGSLAEGALIAGPPQAELMSRKMQNVEHGATEASRNPKDVKINLQFTCSYDSDPRTAISKVRPIVAYTILRSPPKWENEMPLQYRDDIVRIKKTYYMGNAPYFRDSDLRDLVPDSLVRAVAIVGTKNECKAQLETILALNPDHITFRILDGGDELQQLRNLADLLA